MHEEAVEQELFYPHRDLYDVVDVVVLVLNLLILRSRRTFLCISL